MTVLIGITGQRARLGARPGAGPFAAEWLNEYYYATVIRVREAGGVPVFLPLGGDAKELVSRLDGLIISGGEDVDPRRYGQTPVREVKEIDIMRDDDETQLILAAREQGVPVLGICRGQQILNVALGGTLVQHLDPGAGVGHAALQYPLGHRVHEVMIETDSVHHRIWGDRLSVNSFHHQAIDTLGEGLRVAGRASDGVIEAVEVQGANIIGVQWHPEFFEHDPVFKWLVNAAATAGSTR